MNAAGRWVLLISSSAWPREITAACGQAGGHRRVRHSDRVFRAAMAACGGSGPGNSGNRAVRNCADQIGDDRPGPRTRSVPSRCWLCGFRATIRSRRWRRRIRGSGGAELLVRVRYKKTWQYERKEMRDRSVVGLYFAKDASQPVRSMALTHAGPALQTNGSRRQYQRSRFQTTSARSRSIRATPLERRHRRHGRLTDGARRELIAFHPQRDWTRRYWFQDPITLERGTRSSRSTISFDDETPALPTRRREPSRRSQDLSAVRLTLNVIPASRNKRILPLRPGTKAVNVSGFVRYIRPHSSIDIPTQELWRHVCCSER